MRIISNLYPCNCGRRISPTLSFCPYCKSAQKDVSYRLHYNVFKRLPGDPENPVFNILFGGHILAREDIEALLKELVQKNPSADNDYFVGAYVPRTTTDILFGQVYTVEQWYQFLDGSLGENLGYHTVNITFRQHA